MSRRGNEWSRRGVLAGSAGALLVCTGCGSKSTGPPPSTTTQPAGGSSPADASGKALGKVSDIPAGAGLLATGPSGPLLLADSAGKVVAHTAVCTHQGATIDAAGVCPLHGSKFDIATGAVLAGPAAAPLTAVAVKVTDGQVFLA